MTINICNETLRENYVQTTILIDDLRWFDWWFEMIWLNIHCQLKKIRWKYIVDSPVYRLTLHSGANSGHEEQLHSQDVEGLQVSSRSHEPLSLASAPGQWQSSQNFRQRREICIQSLRVADFKHQNLRTARPQHKPRYLRSNWSVERCREITWVILADLLVLNEAAAQGQ